jgi:hypothetical protein
MVGGRLLELKRENIKQPCSLEVVILSTDSIQVNGPNPGGQWFDSRNLLFIYVFCSTNKTVPSDKVGVRCFCVCVTGCAVEMLKISL